MSEQPIPVVMTIAGHDPTGGAGIVADAESILSMGCHPAPVVTAITVQNTTNVIEFTPVDAQMIIKQARTVLEDMPVKGIKIGMLGSISAVRAVHTLLKDYPTIPVVLDPVIEAGGGSVLSNQDIVKAILDLLVPQCTVLTPNSLEARSLIPDADSLDACAMSLLTRGAKFVLVTGTHEETLKVHNILYGQKTRLRTFTWDRLKPSYHGSGCTLSASIAALLAQDTDPVAAMHEAQDFTWQALQSGYRPGKGQHLPNRLFWSLDEDFDATDT